ncbi:hypothetical protein EDC04DRAFT_2888450 [Pisolithus marmoratus]|nr:hypothetical protein EDC04DRAFT_2888450 [Pisolithus marmoratus]
MPPTIHQVEPHAADVNMVDVSQMSRNINDDTHAAHKKLSLLAEYHELFLSQKSCFPPMLTLIFIQPPEPSLSDTPGPLDRKKSTLFLTHQSAIEKTVELVNSVSSQDDDTMRTARCNFI